MVLSLPTPLLLSTKLRKPDRDPPWCLLIFEDNPKTSTGLPRFHCIDELLNIVQTIKGADMCLDVVLITEIERLCHVLGNSAAFASNPVFPQQDVQCID